MTLPVVYPKFRWFVFVALLVATIGGGVSLIWPAPLMQEIAANMQVPLGVATGAGMVSYTVFGTVGAILGGVCFDRLGINRVMIVSVFLLMAGMALTPVIGTTFKGFILTRVITGLASGPLTVSVGVIAATWFPVKERGPIAGLHGMAIAMGVAVGFALVPVAFLKTHSVAATGAWMSLLPLVGLIFFIIVALGPKAPVQATTHQDSAADAGQDFSRAARLPVFFLGILTIFSLVWCMNGFNDLTPVYLSAKAPLGVGHGLLKAGQFMGLLQVSMMVGSALSGFLLEKLFKENVKAMCMVAFPIMALVVLSLRFPAVAGNPSLLPVLLVIYGFFQGWVVPACLTFASLHFPTHIVGKVVGIWMGLGFMGGTVGVIVGATLLHHTSLYLASLLAVTLVAVCGFFFATLLTPPTLFKEAKAPVRRPLTEG